MINSASWLLIGLILGSYFSGISGKYITLEVVILILVVNLSTNLILYYKRKSKGKSTI